VLTIGPSSTAYAQAKGLPRKGQEQQAREKQEQARPAGSRKPEARKVLRLEEMRVEGRVQKPQALFLMPRAGVNSGEQDRTESFLPKAKDALDRDPF